MARPRYVQVPADALLHELRLIGAAINQKGGATVEHLAGAEVVFDYTPPGKKSCVRVFTSLADGAQAVRGCGKDAVRIVVGHGTQDDFKPLEGSQKVLRTAPQNPDESERVDAFVRRLRDILRGAYRRALEVPSCPRCHAPMKRRVGSRGPFLGCTGYPKCRATRELPEEQV